MNSLHLPAFMPYIHKKKRVFRHSNGHFMHVRCTDCDEQAICYSHTQADIKCKGCGSILIKSTGGRSKLVKGKAKKAENVY